MRELEARNRLGLAEIYLRTNRLTEAGNMVESVTTLNASGKFPDINWQALSLKGRLLERTGHHDEALVSLRQAIDVLEGMRRSIESNNLRQSFFADRFNPFKAMVSLLHKSSEDSTKTLEFVDRAKSVALREYLSLPGLQQNWMDVDSRIMVHPIVEYFFAENELLIFITRGERTEAISQNIPKEEFSAQIQEYLNSIKNNDPKSFTRLARLLYDELIVPIERYIFTDSSETLIILPDGPLHLLPFAGLQDHKAIF